MLYLLNMSMTCHAGRDYTATLDWISPSHGGNVGADPAKDHCGQVKPDVLHHHGGDVSNPVQGAAPRAPNQHEGTHPREWVKQRQTTGLTIETNDAAAKKDRAQHHQGV